MTEMEHLSIVLIDTRVYALMATICVCLGNCLQQALRKIGKENIVHNCVFNIEWVTDAAEKELAKSRLNSRGGSVDGIAGGGRRVSPPLRAVLHCHGRRLVGRRFRERRRIRTPPTRKV